MGDAFLYLALTSRNIFVWNIISQLSFGFLSFVQLATNQAENDRCIVKLWTFEKWWEITNWLWHWAFIGGVSVSVLIETSSKACLWLWKNTLSYHLISRLANWYGTDYFDFTGWLTSLSTRWNYNWHVAILSSSKSMLWRCT